jgi:2-polyprenyl-3-methyl-5-hydroxy-6-metoxy-1,4-benzoquinol methylase
MIKKGLDFTHRSYQKELLDDLSIPFNDIRRNMQELEVINQWLGGDKVTLAGIQKLLSSSLSYSGKKRLTICEIGCGGGYNLQVINAWCHKKRITVTLTGIDINPHCIKYAASIPANKGFTFITSDYREVKFSEKPDIIFSSLFCHHFTDEELIAMLHWMRENSGTGFFINDLHRHPMAYLSIGFITRLFSKSYLVKNDAPISVLRGFTKNDWINILSAANITQYSIQWKWAFRWLVLERRMQN